MMTEVSVAVYEKSVVDRLAACVYHVYVIPFDGSYMNVYSYQSSHTSIYIYIYIYIYMHTYIYKYIPT